MSFDKHETIILPTLSKVLSFLLICILLVPFVLAVGAEAAPRYIDVLVPIVLVVFVMLGIVLYFASKHGKRSPA